TWHWTCDHKVTALDPNPLPNTAKVTGTDDFGRSVSATDDHSVIIIHPAIQVVKTGESTAHEGQTVTYGFLVKNTGDVALFNVTYTFKVTNTGDDLLGNISVVDDKLGQIGTINSLASGASKTLTATFKVPDVAAVENTVTACGVDPGAIQVCDDDHHHLVTIH